VSLPPAGGESTDASAAEISATSEQVVRTHMLAALAVGLVPVPVIDMAALTGIQLRMLSRLSKLYDVEFSDQLGKSILGALVGSGGSTVAATASTRFLLQLLPVAGWAAGILSTSVFAGASTFAVGKVFVQHFASGGTFLTLDPQKVREYYSQQLRQGTVEVKSTFAGIKP
jgi:uncharacterized protein (DUF697 family)